MLCLGKEKTLLLDLAVYRQGTPIIKIITMIII